MASAANAMEEISMGHHSEAASMNTDTDMDGMGADMVSHENATITEGSVCEHPHVGDSPMIDCCVSGHSQYFIGTPETRQTEKLLKTTTASFFFTNTVSDSDIFLLSSNHPSTAPPPSDKQSYSSLVGIIKRLD